MKASKIDHKIIIGLFAVVVSCLWIPQTAFGQAEKLGIVTYTPPAGMSKVAKENIVVFSELNECAVVPRLRNLSTSPVSPTEALRSGDPSDRRFRVWRYGTVPEQ